MKSGLPLFAALALASSCAHAQETSSNVERCERPLGTIAVSENQGASQHQLQSYGLGSPVSLLRIMIQQSNCFTVVERGVAMQNLQEERALAASGEMLGGSNIGKGQMQAADFVMTPSVQFTAGDTGGVGGALSTYGGKFLGGLGGIVGGIAGNIKFKEAQTALLIADVRSGIQVAAAEGMAKKTDFGVSGWNWGGAGYSSLGGYTSTPEGKMVAASLLDNYNRIVGTIRGQASLVKTRSHASGVNASASTREGVPVAAGASVFARLATVKVFTEPRASSKLMGTLKRSEEAIATGEERDGFVRIDGENVAGGWVQRTLVSTAPAQQ
ncbi:peptidoglycan-binding protein [Massilia sp. PAMC28688]|uniref:CsgG/HfaB family protein n=1 Tax=Massilia sp. PAMC28688 TaxID=2861283 RepID=UPI001C62F302|nr:CsgG/HfaB family protein [Massilia sp. PAMC28688]QYF92323.1 peptidoglycan-binding protein [Massilia sp. PAMC28688]